MMIWQNFYRIFVLFGTRLSYVSCSVFLLGLFALPGSSDAADISADLRQTREDIRKLDLQLQFLAQTYRKFRVVGKVGLNKRLSDGQINFLLKDYLRASIILLDAVEHPAYRGRNAWIEAVYYLAESLYYNRNFAGATKYYRILVQSRRKYSDQALVRLMEIASKTKKYTWLNQFFQQARQLPEGVLRDKIYYLWAKSVYDQGRLSEAQQLFSQVSSNNAYNARAQYFLGVISLQTLPQNQSIPDATRRLQTALKTLPPKQEQKLRDVIYLSLGRLFLEQGQNDKALDFYRQIDRRSHVFDQALYEICWCYIRRAQTYKTKYLKRREFHRALQALEILLAFLPESPFYPNAQILQGHLQLQLAPFQDKDQDKMFGQAMTSYQTIATRYRGVFQEMDQLMQSRSNPQAFFEDLISRQLDQFQVSSVIPKDAIRWMSSEELMGQTLVMLRDLREMKEMLEGNKQIIQRLESALSLGDQIDLSPSLKQARLQGTTMRSDVISIQSKLNRMMLELVSSKMTPEEKANYQKIQLRLRDLSLLYMQTPKTSAELLSRSKTVLKRIEQLQSRLHNLTIQLNYASRYLTTVRKWLVENPDAQQLTTKQRNELRTDANELEQRIRDLREEHAKLGNELDLANIELGYAAANQQEQSIQREYQRLLTQEKQILDQIKARLSPEEQQQVSEIQGFQERLQSAKRQLRNFFARLQQESFRFRNDVQIKLAQEKNKQEQYRLQIANLEQDSKGLAAQIAYNSFISVRKKFYDLVLRAEVGVIDVAWQEKQTIQTEKLRLTNEKNRELKVLDTEFQDLLQEVK